MPDTNRNIACAIAIAVLLLATACHEGSPNDSVPAATTSAAEDITTADQFYSQREDLMQMRRGIVSLRQALTKDPANYDAAWKLAKFNYYLATHAGDEKERDTAFRDGINAGKTAV